MLIAFGVNSVGEIVHWSHSISVHLNNRVELVRSPE